MKFKITEINIFFNPTQELLALINLGLGDNDLTVHNQTFGHLKFYKLLTESLKYRKILKGNLKDKNHLIILFLQILFNERMFWNELKDSYQENDLRILFDKHHNKYLFCYKNEYLFLFKVFITIKHTHKPTSKCLDIKVHIELNILNEAGIMRNDVTPVVNIKFFRLTNLNKNWEENAITIKPKITHWVKKIMQQEIKKLNDYLK